MSPLAPPAPGERRGGPAQDDHAARLRPAPAPLLLWYNSRCPICNAGIGWQQRRLRRAARAGLIVFRDINDEPEALSPFGATVDDVRRRLHAVDGHGLLLVGIDCAIAIWLRTPGLAWAGRLMQLPGIHAAASVAYDRFADLLFAWNRRKGRW
ncbi:thiol-disulfide oxidoreductase DCC family protein [Zavarzinia sp. CC-PAN008]|uniref:thiol-disulfide oxidoreductase DCC family protein n=1 Tax=Zavarzinia sp. CC-PAN008 TaxID=3243332 RepID=UPI003F743535